MSKIKLNCYTKSKNFVKGITVHEIYGQFQQHIDYGLNRYNPLDIYYTHGKNFDYMYLLLKRIGCKGVNLGIDQLGTLFELPRSINYEYVYMSIKNKDDFDRRDNFFHCKNGSYYMLTLENYSISKTFLL